MSTVECRREADRAPPCLSETIRCPTHVRSTRPAELAKKTATRPAAQSPTAPPSRSYPSTDDQGRCHPRAACASPHLSPSTRTAPTSLPARQFLVPLDLALRLAALPGVHRYRPFVPKLGHARGTLRLR